MIEASKHRPRGYMSGMELCRAMKLPVLPLASKVGLGLDDLNPFYTSEITKLVEYDALYCTACTVKIVRLKTLRKVCRVGELQCAS